MPMDPGRLIIQTSAVIRNVLGLYINQCGRQPLCGKCWSDTQYVWLDRVLAILFCLSVCLSVCGLSAC